MMQRVRQLGMDVDLLTRQGEGYYVTNHDDYHELGSSAPCRGYGNWLLKWAAVLILPGLSATFNGQKASAGGWFVEGVLAEWVSEPKKPDSWEARCERLPKTQKRRSCSGGSAIF